jgi:hypothetical protein
LATDLGAWLVPTPGTDIISRTTAPESGDAGYAVDRSSGVVRAALDVLFLGPGWGAEEVPLPAVVVPAASWQIALFAAGLWSALRAEERRRRDTWPIP